MEHTSCTEDRIHHALDRCLYGLGHSSPNTQPWNAGLCINRWSLEELVKRDPRNFIILLQQILRKTREVLEQSQDELVVPLALLFSSTLLQTPHFSPDSGVLQEACDVFHCFLSWPEPCCSASRHLLSLIQQELRAPGISFQRLLREEQGLTTTTSTNHSKTMTVLLMSPGEDVPPELLSVSEQLSGVCHSQRDTSITLIKHAFQAALGTKYPLQILHHALQSKGAEDLEQLVTAVTEALETAASTQDPDAARESLLQSLKGLVESIGIPPPDCHTSPGNVHTLTLPLAKCHMYSWDKDNFDILNDLLQSELDQLPVFNLPTDKGEEDDEDEETEEETIKNRYTDHRISTVSICSKDSMFSSYSLSSSLSVPSTLSESSGVDSDFSEDLETDDSQPETRRRPKSKVHLSQRFSMLFKSQRSSSLCRRAQSMGSRGDVIRDGPSGALFKRSKSLPRQVRLPRLPRSSGVPAPTSDGPFPQSHHVCVRKRPILSCEEGDGVEMSTLVRVVVFGGDREAGRLARAYTDLQQRESRCPRLTRAYRLQFYFVPVKRGNLGGPGGVSIVPEGHLGSLLKCPTSTKSNAVILEDSTTDIAQLIGMTDPWYKQSVLSLLSLSSDVLCQTTSKVDCDSDSSSSERVLLLADLVLYYCRNAAQPVLLQLYQAELTLAGGEKRREVFIHSLELGHTAGTRAVKAMGAASKRFGIDGDREALPLALYIVYNKVFVSGRSQRTETDMVCTSINLRKACKRPQQLDSKMESLHLTMTEVLKIQSSKSKKNYNQQISRSEVKVDKVQVSGGSGITFPVCLDQDEKKIIQSVIRCEVSLCCKPGSGSDWRSHRSRPSQVQPLHPSFCSLLCLPITSFCGSQPS
ncbi:phosphoinositide 3-kinase regulatory subunit 5-like [Oncorhynchus clarkii lewisi]|uniref:phosphoinositide 3-kinase regulatory subunit 5-like n=1 Tax=Oncorhynchus clarkii lewisi TaxID=490388 RepID=UPI0039B8AB18